MLIMLVAVCVSAREPPTFIDVPLAPGQYGDGVRAMLPIITPNDGHIFAVPLNTQVNITSAGEELLALSVHRSCTLTQAIKYREIPRSGLAVAAKYRGA